MERSAVLGLNNFEITDIREHATNKVTEHPVETGGVIIDNVVKMPLKITVRGYLRTTSPMYFENFLIRDSTSQLYEVRTPQKTYSNLSMTSVSSSRTNKLFGYMELSIEFTQVTYTKKAAKAASPDDS